MLAGSRLLSLIAGVGLLVAGRRLYWLLVGLVGFVLGFALTSEYLPGPQWLILLGGLAVGLLAAGLAVFFQKAALGVTGFLIGGLAVLWWAEEMGWDEPWWVWLTAALAGALGAYLVRRVFEAALVILSSVLGATFVLEALERPADELSPIFVALVAGGILAQFLSSRSRKRE